MIDPKLNSIGRISEQLLSEVSDFLPPTWREKTQRSLNFALDFLKPQARALGLRVARFSKSKIEVVLPLKERNFGGQGLMSEGALVTASLEACRWVWNQNQPNVPFEIQFRQVQLNVLRPLRSSLHIRFELSETSREKVYYQISQTQKAEDQAHLLVYDQDEQLIAQLDVTVYFSQAASLDWT